MKHTPIPATRTRLSRPHGAQVALALPALLVTLMAVFQGCTGPSSQIAVVEGESMVPTLLGEHWRTTCHDCGFPYTCNARSFEMSGTSVCPNCGFDRNAQSDHFQQPAQRYALSEINEPIQRWDKVAFRYPAEHENRGKSGVKRVVGLPGETIRFTHGLVWRGNSLLAMDWQRVLETRIPVYDSRYQAQPSVDLSPRFRPRKAETGWRQSGNTWSFDPRGLEADQYDYLDYVHWRCCRHSGARSAPHWIEDYYGHDQAIARELHSVHQVAVALSFEMDLKGRFELSINRPYGRWMVVVDGVTNQIIAKLDQFEAITSSFDPGAIRDATLELSTIGGSLHLIWNGKLLGRWDDVRLTESVTAASSQPVEANSNSQDPKNVEAQVTLAASGGAILIKRIQVFRGLHYFDDALDASGQPRTYQLAADEFLVVGDNVPNSIDSRHWERPGIHRREILGIVNTVAGN